MTVTGAGEGKDRAAAPASSAGRDDRCENATTATLMDSAPRRTWLAAERTYLAWLRTGLGALGLAIAVGRLLPALVDASHVEFGLLGIAFGVLGVLLLVLAAYRTQRVRSALERQRPLPTDAWTIWVLTGVALVLAALTVLLIAVAV
jgi:putative membrane protein